MNVRQARKLRRSIYSLSAAAVPLLMVWGVEAGNAATYVAAAVAAGNCVMAALNVPGDDEKPAP